MFQQTKNYLQQKMPATPSIAVVLGSGLGGFADELSDPVEIPYAEIPGWPRSTAIGHHGRLFFGKLGSVNLAVLSGRAHLYEGYSASRVAYAMRIMKLIGVKSVILTNAAGGINLSLQQGGLVLISDHINLQGTNPLVGANEDDLGPRFPDMSEVYDERLREIAKRAAAEIEIPLTEGVYAAMLGPSYETPAEIRFLRLIGADLVGMSTVPEAIAANHMGMRVLAISCVTNMAAGVLKQRINHEEVLETGQRVRETFVQLLKAVIPRLEAEK
jgi:purine-nucleoside phosphorylase